MTQHVPPQAMSLFDLIGRHWTVKNGVVDVQFNQDGSALTALLTCGSLAFLSTKDAESPDVRMRQEVDTGRMTLRPREKALPPVLYGQDTLAQRAVGVARYGDKGFAFLDAETGALWRATARGQMLRIPEAEDAAISALTQAPGWRSLWVARDGVLEERSADGGVVQRALDAPHAVEGMDVSPDGRLMACWGAGRISVLQLDNGAVRFTADHAPKIAALSWTPCGSWLVAGCADKAVTLCRLADGALDRITDFPAAVNAVDTSARSNMLLAAGAFRIVGWALPDLPFGDHQGTPTETGKPGLTVVERLAIHQGRDICAACYGNGMVVACRAGQPDELMIDQGRGASVTAMKWSPDGKHLAWGDVAGNLSIATFPKDMFK